MTTLRVITSRRMTSSINRWQAMPTASSMLARSQPQQTMMNTNMMAAGSMTTMQYRSAVQTLYTDTHEWFVFDDEEKTAKIGLSKASSEHLGQVLFVGFPPEGEKFQTDDEVCDIESVKAAAKVFAPLDGTLSKVNQKLNSDEEGGNPGKAGTAAEDASDEDGGWLVQFDDATLSPSKKYMNAEAYAKFLKDEPIN